jgi:hypothetical protein
MNGLTIHRTQHRIWLLILMIAGLFVTGCAGAQGKPQQIIYQSGLNVVRLDTDPVGSNNSHPAKLSATEIGTLLRSVRAWEQRNFIHRLFSGEADRTRAFRNDEIQVLAPALSKALAQAKPDQRVYLFKCSLRRSPRRWPRRNRTSGCISI